MSYQANYERIADEYIEKIKSGELAPGDKLPSITRMKDQYHISETVVRNVILVLRTLRLVEGKPGSGVYVTEPEDRLCPELHSTPAERAKAADRKKKD